MKMKTARKKTSKMTSINEQRTTKKKKNSRKKHCYFCCLHSKNDYVNTTVVFFSLLFTLSHHTKWIRLNSVCVLSLLNHFRCEYSAWTMCVCEINWSVIVWIENDDRNLNIFTSTPASDNTKGRKWYYYRKKFNYYFLSFFCIDQIGWILSAFFSTQTLLFEKWANAVLCPLDYEAIWPKQLLDFFISFVKPARVPDTYTHYFTWLSIALLHSISNNSIIVMFGAKNCFGKGHKKNFHIALNCLRTKCVHCCTMPWCDIKQFHIWKWTNISEKYVCTEFEVVFMFATLCLGHFYRIWSIAFDVFRFANSKIKLKIHRFAIRSNLYCAIATFSNKMEIVNQSFFVYKMALFYCIPIDIETWVVGCFSSSFSFYARCQYRINV